MKIAITHNVVVSIPGNAALHHHHHHHQNFTLKPYQSSSILSLRGDRISRSRKPRAAVIGFGSVGYEDEGHVDYYDEVGERKRRGKREKKRRMELVDCLVKDLSAFSELGFGEDDDEEEGSEMGVAKAKMVSEAAELLRAQLMQIREAEKKTEKKEKKEKKDEMKRRMKAAKTKMKPDCESSSSSSESSSDSECDQVVDMAQLKRGLTLPPVKTLSQLDSQAAVHEALVTVNLASEPQNALNMGDACCNSICDGPAPAILESNTAEKPVETTDNSKTLQLNASVASGLIDISTSSSYGSVTEAACDDAASSWAKKVEVCMGGKCKKSGAPALMEEFQRVLGGEAAVVGCKCLGKCKNAPNVRVLQNSGEMDEPEGNPLCIGVSLNDVGVIVANYLSAEVKDYGVPAA
ncbi:Diacylglycerol O-acyltransferase 3-like protein [Drosera capensis]